VSALSANNPALTREQLCKPNCACQQPASCDPPCQVLLPLQQVTSSAVHRKIAQARWHVTWAAAVDSTAWPHNNPSQRVQHHIGWPQLYTDKLLPAIDSMQVQAYGQKQESHDWPGGSAGYRQTALQNTQQQPGLQQSVPKCARADHNNIAMGTCVLAAIQETLQPGMP
jgi:hypothetical protein